MAKNFTPSSNTYAPGNVPLASSQIDPIQTISADGAITIMTGLVAITKTSAAAVTLAVPDQDGQRLAIVATTAYAHTITTPTPGYNNTSAFTVITLSGVIGDMVVLESQGGVWWVEQQGFNGNRYQAIQAISGDGAITIKNGLVILSKGSAAAITIADPTTGVDDGATLRVITTTAQAHVITDASSGFNAKGSSGTITYTAAIGNSVDITAYGGKWYTPVKTGVTVA